jgi:putative inorganic carbon (HCO3(-)) transporter
MAEIVATAAACPPAQRTSGLASFRPDLLVALFLGVLWARVSDVGITEYALPSLAVPFAVGLICFRLAQRLALGERLNLATFLRLLPFLPYAIVVTLSALWATAPDVTLTTAFDLTKNLLIFWVLVELIGSVRTLRACCLALTLATAGLAGLSVYQQATASFASDYGGFAQASVRQIVGSVSLYRLAGPVGDPNYYALILLVVVPIGLALIRARLHPLLRMLTAGGIVLIGDAVLLTYSRGGALVLALGATLSLLQFRFRALLLPALGVALPLAILLAPAPVWDRLGTLLSPFQDTNPVGQVVDDSVELRLGAQQIAFEMFLDHPFAGVGAGNYPLQYEAYSRRLGVRAVASAFSPHNLYLQVAAETGLLGLLTFVPPVLVLLVALHMARRASDAASPAAAEWSELAAGIEVALLCYLVASLMLHASYPRYLWMLLALTVGALRTAPCTAARTW